MKNEKLKTKAVGHLRFTLEGDELAVGPWSLSVSALTEAELRHSGLAGWLRSMATMIEKGMYSTNAPADSVVSRGLQYHRFHLVGDPPKDAPKPMTAEELAETLEAAARQVLLPDRMTDIVAFNLIVSLADHLFGCAMQSNRQAQRALMWAAQNIVNQFISAAWAKAPGIIEEAENLPWVPGQVSLGPEVGETMKEMCRRVKQGDKFTGPPQKDTAKGKKATLATAQHHLVERLYRHMESYQHNAAIVKRRKPDVRIEELPPLMQRMARLKPFGEDSVREWIAVAKEVILDATGGEPLKHPAFKSGGEFESLGNLDRRGEPALWKSLREAWRYRAGRAAESSGRK